MLEILYNVMQRPVGNDQRAYRAQQTVNKCTGLHLFTMWHVHSLKIRMLQLTLKKLVHKGADLYVQNALKLTYEHLQLPKNSEVYTPGPPLKGRGERGRKQGKGKGCIRLLGDGRSVVNNENNNDK